MAKKAAKCAAKEPLVVASKVRAHIKSQGALTSGELIGAINCKVYCVLSKAIERAKANKRSTVKAQDL